MTRQRRTSIPHLSLVALLLLSGCESSPGPEQVEAVSISPAGSIELTPGARLQLAAATVSRSGSVVSGHPVTWRSSRPDIASVSASGLVTAHLVGTTEVTAESAGRSGSVTVTVAPGVCQAPAAGPIAVGETRSGSFGPQDCLLFSELRASGWELELSSATHVRIDLSSAGIPLDLIITDTHMRTVAWGEWIEDGRLRAVVELEAGRYFVWAASFAPGSTASYEISVSEAHLCMAGVIEAVIRPGDSFDGTLNDDDCLLPHARYGEGFRLVLDESTGLRMLLTSSDFEPLLAVTDLELNVRWWSDFGFDVEGARIERMVPAGEYIVWATGWDHAAGTYRLSMEEVEIQVCPAVGTTSIGGTAHGTLSQASCTGPDGRFMDPWVIQVPETTTLQIDLTSADFDAYLILEDANGAHLAEDDDGGVGLNSRLVHTVTAGEYRIVATTFWSGEVGNYQITTQAVAGGQAMMDARDGPDGPFGAKRRRR